MLRVDQVSKSFDGIDAVKDATVEFQPGFVYALIGPNGAGKTTLLNLINGFITPDKGKIFINGEKLIGKYPWEIAKIGVGRLFQDLRIFPKMKVIDNIILAKRFKAEENPLLSLLRMKSNKETETAYQVETAFHLSSLGIGDKTDSYSEDISFGQEKLLSLSRLFMGDFDILLLDEPVAGVGPHIKEIIYQKIREMASMGKLIIIVEHEMEAIRKVADYALFMNDGEIVRQGKPEEVLEDEIVINQYIGLESLQLSTLAEISHTTDNVLLKTENLCAAYYKRDVLRGISVELKEKEIVGLIGPNGAGKSTLLKVLAGILPTKRGKIYYSVNGHFINITSFSSRQRVKMGMGYFIQGGEVFPDLIVEENLHISAHNMSKYEIEKQKSMCFDLFPILYERRKMRAGLLSGGERQMLALAMILMKQPRIMIWLDEPSAGLAPIYTGEMISKIREIRDRFSTSILLVEQRIGEVVSIADRVYIMRTGEVVEENVPNKINKQKLEGIFMGNHNRTRSE